MSAKTKSVLFVSALLFSLVSLSRADVVTQIGTQHFTDGQTGIGTVTFTTAVAGQPAPFDNFYGSDPSGPNFSESWTFAYTLPLGSTITGASVTIGSYDFDTAGVGNQVASFLLDTTFDLTADANTVFEASPIGSGGYKVYTIAIPSAALSTLVDGSATFALTLQNGLGVLGATPFNGGGMDFSSLDIQVQAVPEPATALLVGLGVLALLARHRTSR